MTKKCVLASCVFALCLSAGTAHAEKMLTGKQLLEVCISKKESSRMGCVGYIYGFVKGMAYQRSVTATLLGSVKPMEPAKFFDPVLNVYCIPTGVKMGQIELIVKEYLLNHPNDLHISSSELVLKSMIQAFPCH